MSYPRNVRIVKSSNEFLHGFPVGSIVTLTRDDESEGKYKAFSGNGPDVDGRTIWQSIMLVDFEELEPVVEAQSEEQKEVAARVKYLYSVQDEDGYRIAVTSDREYAREVKAFSGGKKEGIIIMAYAPVKEIR